MVSASTGNRRTQIEAGSINGGPSPHPFWLNFLQAHFSRTCDQHLFRVLRTSVMLDRMSTSVTKSVLVPTHNVQFRYTCSSYIHGPLIQSLYFIFVSSANIGVDPIKFWVVQSNVDVPVFNSHVTFLLLRLMFFAVDLLVVFIVCVLTKTLQIQRRVAISATETLFMVQHPPYRANFV